MPIKYNLTKYDILAQKIHELSQKSNAPFSKDEEISRAEAVILTAFSSLSWQTHNIVEEGNPNKLNSQIIKSEFVAATDGRWKQLKNSDIQEVSCLNIRDGFVFTWMSLHVPKPQQENYKLGWVNLKRVFNEECDGISSIQRQQH